MKVKISELFQYRQFKNLPLSYCFDRKEYRICDMSVLETEKDFPYQRYIPLLQIDEEQIQNDFINSYHNEPLIKAYNETRLCFRAFLDERGMFAAWWDYYKEIVFQQEKAWCEKHSIAFDFDL